MMKKITMTLPVLLACLALPAQNSINQSVEITNDYKTQMADLQKGEVNISIPDSLHEFDYQFDYSVFDSPYKGAYEFSPYFIQMTPDKSVYDGTSFRLRAGAGYTLHPVLDFVWTPVRNSSTALTVMNSGKGYIGEFLFGPTDQAYNGYDVDDRLGFQADFIGKGFYSKLYGGWNGIFSKSTIASSCYNALNLGFGVKSRNDNPSFFFYDFDLGYRYAADNMGSFGTVGAHDISLTGCIGPVIKKKFRILVDFRGELESLADNGAGTGDYTHFTLDATPHIVLDAGIFHLDAGIAVDYTHADRNLFSLSPMVKASLSIVRDIVDFYAGFTGGQEMHTYSSLKEFNHFAFATVPEITQTRYNAFGGFKGSIGPHFDYDAKVGYMVVDNALLSFPTIQYGNMAKLYVDFDFAWHSDRLDVDGDFSFAPVSYLYSGLGFQSPKYKGDFRVTYNWNRRIYVGATARIMADRKCPDLDYKWIPGYIDPGVFCEFKLSRAFGLWIEGGNFLGNRIYDVPAYIMKSPHFTVGVSCSL